jgi:hypothetical protein
LPGLPFVILNDFEFAWSFCIVGASCGLFEKGVKDKFIIIGDFWRAFDR